MGRLKTWVLPGALCLLLAAGTMPGCGDTDSAAQPNPTADISFSPDRMISVEIELDPADWTGLNADSRFGPKGDYGDISGQCDVPWPNAYDWFEAKVTVDGETLDRLGVRKKGFVGSESATIPAMKIKTDKFVDGRFFGDTERITLNNNSGDPTIMKSCLTFEIFAAAGHPAPRCNLADVWVNGEHLGAYTHVEAIKKRFLKVAFGDNGGSLYEGTGTDFVVDWLPRWEIKTSDTDPTWAPLLGVAEALQAPDDELAATLAPVLNIDRYITFWALEVILNHADGYAADHNNYYVYFDPTDDGRAVFIPWGVDKTLDIEGWAFPIDTFLNAELPRRLSRIPALAEQMAAELRRIMAEVWDEDALLARIDLFESQLEAVGSNNPAGVQALRDWVHERPAEIADIVAVGLPAGAAEMSSCAGGADADKDDDDDKPCTDGETFEYEGVLYECANGTWGGKG